MFGIWENKRKELKVWELGRTRNCNQKLCNGQKKIPASYNPPQKCEGDNKIHMHRRRPMAKAPPRTKRRARPNFGAARGREVGDDGTRSVPPRGRAAAGRRCSRGSSAPRTARRLWAPAATRRNAAGNFNKLGWRHQDAAGTRPGADKVPPRVSSQLSHCKRGKASQLGSTGGTASPAAPAPAGSAAARAPAPAGGDEGQAPL